MTNYNGDFLLPEMTNAFRLLIVFGMAAARSASDPGFAIIAPDETVLFTAEDFAASPHAPIQALEIHGQKEHRFRGVALRDRFLKAGAPFGAKLRGPALQPVAIAHTRDSHAVAFSLAEFKEASSSRTSLLAEAEDGNPRLENAAPFRLVVSGDKKSARWERMGTALEIGCLASAVPSMNL